MVDRNSESYMKSEQQVKKMLVTMVNKQRKAKGFDPLPMPSLNKADSFKSRKSVKRIPKQ